ncbi:MAG: sulfurtransferase TusA family protein [Aquificae bacterium]|nr:sulfurtransferase TusA family protein [Aquificota bacterium]
MEVKNIKADVVHDVTGTYCPVPVVETSNQIKQMKIGQVLEIIADDPGSVEDIPAWCKSTGQEFLGMYEEDGEFHFFIRKTKELK